MNPTELRAKAKALRAEAARCVKEAEDIEAREAHHRRVRCSRESAEQRAEGHARPLWVRDPGDGVYVVAGIEGGCFHVARIWPAGDPPVVRRYVVRDGTRLAENWERVGVEVVLSKVDNVATMNAWRAWCARNRAENLEAP